MISFLRGIVRSKDAASVSLDVGGVGYSLSMTQDALASLPALGEEALVVCRMIVTDNAVSLYGFATDTERHLFDELITVSGIGPKTALAALSSFSASQLVQAIASQDVRLLSKIPGVGKKSASRIALELKDHFPDDGGLFGANAGEANSNAAFPGVAEALLSMGFTNSEVSHALEGASEDDPESIVLQNALKRLAR